jgi:hypothetical protein
VQRVSDSIFAMVFGSVIWFAGGAGLVAAMVSGWTLFVPFALVVILLGMVMTGSGVVGSIRKPR